MALQPIAYGPPITFPDLGDGTAAAPALAFSGEATGFFQPGANKIGFSINGTEMARLTSTGLTIGAATDPTVTLQVQASNAQAIIKKSTVTDGTFLAFEVSAGQAGRIERDSGLGIYFASSQGAPIGIKHTSSQPIEFYTNGLARGSVTGDGKWAFGTTAQTNHTVTIGVPETPTVTTADLGIYGTSTAYAIFREKGSDVETLIGSDTGGAAGRGYLACFSHQLDIRCGSAVSMTFETDGGVKLVRGALATNATDGFLWVRSCAGAPTGAPTAVAGAAPIVIDSTNNKLYFYSGGAWRDAGP